MHCAYGITPHGRRTVDLGQIRSSLDRGVTAAAQRAPVNKWQVFRDVSAARATLGVNDRALTVLNALLSFHPDNELSGGNLVVFPSNSQLSARANGIAGATLRRALSALVTAGLVERRDSPNGKRYARRNGAGEIARAFGFNLAPLLARAAELAAAAASLLKEAEERRATREAFSLCRRDVRKLVATAMADGAKGDWTRISADCDAIIVALPRNPELAELRAALTAMTALRAEVINALELKQNAPEMGASERHFERHIESQKTESLFESEKISEILTLPQRSAPPPNAVEPQPSHPPLDMVLSACPQIQEYARGQQIRSWRELYDAAALVSRMLDISKSAWMEASTVMGPENAAASIAHMLQRHDAIKSPGGYLRTLTDRARSGSYEPTDIIMSLMAQPGRGPVSAGVRR